MHMESTFSCQIVNGGVNMDIIREIIQYLFQFKKKNPVNLLEFRTISILMLNIRGKQGNFGATGAYTSTLHCSTYSLLYLSICMLPKRPNECPYGDR